MSEGPRVFWIVLRNDVRLFWRSSYAGKLVGAFRLAPLLLISVVLHGLAVIGFRITGHPLSDHTQALIYGALEALMVFAAAFISIERVFNSSDAALLLSCPAPTVPVLLARLCSIVGSVFLSVAVLTTALFDAEAVAFSARFLWGYAATALLAAIAAVAGMTWTLLLVRLFGPRSVRTFSQAFVSCALAGWYLVFQLVKSSGAATRQAWSRHLSSALHALGFPVVARAGRGDLRSLLEVAAAAVLGIAVMAALMGRVYLSGLQSADGIRSRPPGKRTGWSDNLATAAFWKDFRLIARDPFLIAQVVPRMIWLIPAAIGLLRSPALGATAFGLIGINLSATCGPILTAVCVDGEEGWDLICVSPTSEIRLRWSKLWAGLALPLAAAAALCVVTALHGRWFLALLSFLMAGLCGAGVSWVCAARGQRRLRAAIARNSTGNRGFGLLAILTGSAASAAVALIGSDNRWAALSGWVVLAATVLAMTTLLVVIEPREASDELV